MRSLDLFTGYGGLTLALEPWCRPIAYVEIEEYPQRIIAERMADRTIPRAPILADVKNVQGSPGDCDIIVGGFPCQDLSVAGNGEGLGGKRSGLFWEIARLTEEIRPSFVFLENVPAIRIRGLWAVAKEFTALGYDCRWTSVSAGYVGAPHKRERWFMLAHSNGSSIREQSRGSSRQTRKKKALAGVALQNRSTANTNGQRLEGLSRKESRYLQSSELHRQRWLEIEPAVCRGHNGLANRVERLKALGNGVVPAQARLAFQYLMGLEPYCEVEK